MPEIKNYDCKVTEEPVTLTKADGSVGYYVIREALGTEREEYLTELATRTKTDPATKQTTVAEFKGLNIFLLNRVMFNATVTQKVGGEPGEAVYMATDPISIAELNVLPSRVLEGLAKQAKELGALDKVGEDNAKND